MQHRVDYIGTQRSPILVIEDAWPNVEALIDIAARRTDYGVRSLYYPGVRSPAPPEYATGIVARLAELIRSELGVSGELTITDSTFSIVATPAEKLVPFQRVPHYDSVDPNRIALLHYLSNLGGTSFYRHRGTGVEIVTAEIEERYIRTVNADVR